MRIVVIGTSGSGKSTFAAQLAARTSMPRIELDELNWGPGWFDRSKRAPDEFIAAIERAITAESWVCAGNYKLARDLVWRRATHVVWFDLPHWIVLKRVLFRSLSRASSGREVFPGCRETWSKLLAADHPIRYAWSTHARRRAQYEAMSGDPAHASLRILRCRSVAAVHAAMARLTTEINDGNGSHPPAG